MQNEEILNDKIDNINSDLVKANAFNEDAALTLDLIYNFLSVNRNLFGSNTPGMPHLDSFFDKNGYVPVKVLNPCCENKEKSSGGLPFPKLPIGGPVPVPVPELAPAPAPKPVVVPLPHPISTPIPLTPPSGVVSTPPAPMPTPAPIDAPIVMPTPEAAPDLKGSPALPPMQAPDLNPVSPSLPAVPITAPETQPFLTDTTGIVDPGQSSDADFKGMLVLGAAVIGASAAAAGIAALSAVEFGAYLLGGAGIMAAVPALADEAPTDSTPSQSGIDDNPSGFKSDYLSKISYSTNEKTDEITLKADEIKFISDVIRFKNTGSVLSKTAATYGVQNASYSPPSTPNTDTPKTENTGTIAASHESVLGGNTTATPKPAAPINSSRGHEDALNGAKPAAPSSNSGMSSIKDVGSSLSSIISSVGKTLSDLSSKTFMTAKVPPAAKSIDPTKSQPVVYNSESTGPVTAGVSNPIPAMTTFEQDIFTKSGMFT